MPQQRQRASSTQGLVVDYPHSHALAVFVLTEAQAAEIRTAYEQHGEFSAVVELRRLFPGVGDIAWARECRRRDSHGVSRPVYAHRSQETLRYWQCRR